MAITTLCHSCLWALTNATQNSSGHITKRETPPSAPIQVSTLLSVMKSRMIKSLLKADLAFHSSNWKRQPPTRVIHKCDQCCLSPILAPETWMRKIDFFHAILSITVSFSRHTAFLYCLTNIRVGMHINAVLYYSIPLFENCSMKKVLLVQRVSSH